jgi:hypothetical protein
MPPVPYHTCKIGHQFLHPIVVSSVIPFYNDHIKLYVECVDEKINLGENVKLVQLKLVKLNTKYAISDKVTRQLIALRQLSNSLYALFTSNVWPQLCKSGTLFKQKVFPYYKLSIVQLKNWGVSLNNVYDNSPLKPTCDQLKQKLRGWIHNAKDIEFVALLIKWGNDVVEAILNTTNNISLQEKKDFLKQEFENLTKFNGIYKFNETKNVVAIVNRILQEVQSKTDSVKEKFKDYKATSSEEFTSFSSTESLANTDPIADTISTTVSETNEVNDGSSSVGFDEENVEEEGDEEDSEDYDEEPLTVQVTSTLTVTQDDSTESETNGVSIEHVDPKIQKLNSELEYWENKVNKTLQLATNNLEIEMKPIVDDILETIKPNVSKSLQHLQNMNHKNYQTISQKISSINKDYEQIYLTNDTSVETVTREEIRADIKYGYELGEESSQEVRKILYDTHEKVLREYFRVLQDTIDILESFADNTIAEFNKKLTTLLEELSLDDDEVAWKAWKRFHKVKEEIFEFRDFIFDSANEYQSQDVDSSKLQTIGLNLWNEYVENIDFHINSLLSDNDDYLKIFRAQANVAFQLREEIVNKLEVEKEMEEQERREKEEREKEESEKEEIEMHSREHDKEMSDVDSDEDEEQEEVIDTVVVEEVEEVE